MSPMITGVLFIVGVLLITLSEFAEVIITTDTATLAILDGLLGFLAIFIMLWALISLSLHPAIDDTVKTLFFVLTVLLVMSVIATNFNASVLIGKLP